jgi:energy-converting hydrogenase B subunit D
MTTLLLLLDLMIVASLLLLARQVLFRTALFAAVVYFIAFSMLLALAWVRLKAPDVALAEVAIGAGLTGALLLAAVRRIALGSAQRPTKEVYHEES